MIIFIRQIITYSILKPFSVGQEYFNKHFSECSRDSNDIDSNSFSHYAQLVQCGSLRFGVAGIIITNIALASFGILLMVISDTILIRMQELWIRILLQLFCFAFCILKFDVFPIKSELDFLKFLFVLLSLFSRLAWVLAYLIFVAVENITLI